MTDRYFSLTVALEKDFRDDDCKHLINAIKMFRGVINVKGNISNLEVWTAEQRAQSNLRDKLFDLLLKE